MYSKIHKVADQIVLACCDKELLGKVLEEGEYYLEVKENFYKGELIDEEKLVESLKAANNINLLGNRAVKVALEKGFVDENQVVKIKNIAHVQIFKV